MVRQSETASSTAAAAAGGGRHPLGSVVVVHASKLARFRRRARYCRWHSIRKEIIKSLRAPAAPFCAYHVFYIHSLDAQCCQLYSSMCLSFSFLPQSCTRGLCSKLKCTRSDCFSQPFSSSFSHRSRVARYFASIGLYLSRCF